MTAHARLSPSAASRWMSCPGSIRLSEGIPNTSSAFAEEGTAAHSVLEMSLNCGLDPYDFVGQRFGEIEITETMARHLADIVDRVGETPGHLYVETRVELGPWLPNQFGTLDIAIWREETGDLHIRDLKYGQGVRVVAENNKQLRIYAIGFIQNVLKDWSKVRRIHIEIEQPRIDGFDRWTINVEELLEFAKEVKAAGEATNDPKAPLRASPEACQWCPAKAICPEHDRWNLNQIGLMFEDLDAQELKLDDGIGMTVERRSVLLRHKKMIEAWLELHHAAALSDALKGLPTPGLKAVYGRPPHRAWTDQSAVQSLLEPALGVDTFNIQLKSPAQIEEITKPITRGKNKRPGAPELWEQVVTFVDRGDPAPILVPEEDKREAIRPHVDLFDDISNERT